LEICRRRRDGAEASGFDDSAWTVIPLPHSFNDVDGLKPVGRVGGKTAAQEELATAGPPAQIKRTPITGPDGLQAGAGCGAHRCRKSRCEGAAVSDRR